MTKTATLSMNEKTGKWEASYGGQVFVKSASKEYVVNMITNQISSKAKKLGITEIEEIGQQYIASKKQQDPALKFGINERFQILQDFVDMVASRTIPSVIVTGEGGLGKSHTVIKALKSSGLISTDDLDIGEKFEVNGRKSFTVVKGFSTAKGMFRTLYENRNKIVVFDDCDSVIKCPVAANILKACLDSYDKRIVTWNSEGWSDDELPRSFEFTGGVVFISNMPMYKIPQALISRSMPADVSMTRPEIIERMAAIIEENEFLPEYDKSMKLEALEFISENSSRSEVRSINLRTLINVTKARASKPESWKRLALYAMLNAG